MQPRLAFALLLAANAARAQPVTHPCTARVVLAPDDVRREIEAWVAAEPRCERELEVRAVPTVGGFYLSAKDDAGHVRERIVPDAQSAAVLVVSWMADDSVAAIPEDTALVLPTVAPTVPATDSESPFTDSLARRYSGPDHRHFLTFGLLAQSSDHVGFRAQADLVTRGRWSFGVAGSYLGDHDARYMSSSEVGHASAFVAASHQLGPVTLRAQLGFGADVRRRDMEEREVIPAFDAAVLAGIALGDRWRLIGGPVLDAPRAGPATVSAMIGVQYGL